MEEAGIPFSHSRLLHLHDRASRLSAVLRQRIERRHSLRLGGPGSVKSKTDFLDRLIHEIHTDARSHPLLQLTKKTKRVSWAEINRNLLASLLPENHPLQEPLALATRESTAAKLVTTYLHKLLFHRRHKPDQKQEVVLPQRPTPLHNPDTHIAYPSIYLVPSSRKDSPTDEGGQMQGRLSFKNPALQTFPPILKTALQSRFLTGCIHGFDLSQIELRTAALLSGDPSLIDTYLRGGDLHTELAVHCEGPTIVDHPHFGSGNGRLDPRQWYKKGNFLILYRGSAAKLQHAILEDSGRLLTLDFCEGVVSNLRSIRHGLWLWQDSLINHCHQHGRLEVPFIGASRTFLGGEDFEENEIVNFPIQLLAAAITERIQIRLDRTLHENHLNSHIIPFANWYDALFFDVEHPNYIPILNDLIASAVEWVTTTGLWGQLERLYRRHVPVTYDTFTQGTPNA